VGASKDELARAARRAAARGRAAEARKAEARQADAGTTGEAGGAPVAGEVARDPDGKPIRLFTDAEEARLLLGNAGVDTTGDDDATALSKLGELRARETQSAIDDLVRSRTGKDPAGLTEEERARAIRNETLDQSGALAKLREGSRPVVGQDDEDASDEDLRDDLREVGNREVAGALLGKDPNSLTGVDFAELQRQATDARIRALGQDPDELSKLQRAQLEQRFRNDDFDRRRAQEQDRVGQDEDDDDTPPGGDRSGVGAPPGTTDPVGTEPPVGPAGQIDDEPADTGAGGGGGGAGGPGTPPPAPSGPPPVPPDVDSPPPVPGGPPPPPAPTGPPPPAPGPTGPPAPGPVDVVDGVPVVPVGDANLDGETVQMFLTAEGEFLAVGPDGTVTRPANQQEVADAFSAANGGVSVDEAVENLFGGSAASQPGTTSPAGPSGPAPDGSSPTGPTPTTETTTGTTGGTTEQDDDTSGDDSGDDGEDGEDSEDDSADSDGDDSAGTDDGDTSGDASGDADGGGGDPPPSDGTEDADEQVGTSLDPDSDVRGRPTGPLDLSRLRFGPPDSEIQPADDNGFVRPADGTPIPDGPGVDNPGQAGVDRPRLGPDVVPGSRDGGFTDPADDDAFGSGGPGREQDPFSRGPAVAPDLGGAAAATSGSGSDDSTSGDSDDDAQDDDGAFGLGALAAGARLDLPPVALGDLRGAQLGGLATPLDDDDIPVAPPRIPRFGGLDRKLAVVDDDDEDDVDD
jgi:hypothetical protein